MLTQENIVVPDPFHSIDVCFYDQDAEKVEISSSTLKKEELIPV